MKKLAQVKNNKKVSYFIKQTEKVLKALSYTDHGFRHANLVSDMAIRIAQEIGLGKKEQEMAGIAGYCHDMGNFLSRTLHNYLGSVLFSQVFGNSGLFNEKELVTIMQAISNHDKRVEDMSFADPISAVVVLADKTDVHRSRVIVKKMEEIRADIHDRVNYATTTARLKIDKHKKKITLVLKIDTNFVPVMEYFEIFTERMIFCRKAAESLGYNFGLVINKFRLL